MDNYEKNKNYKSDSVDNEVKRLFKLHKGKISTTDFMKLRHKYDDNDLVDKIQRIYLEKHNKINKRAKKFAQLIRDKYSHEEYPFHLLLEKAKLLDL